MKRALALGAVAACALSLAATVAAARKPLSGIPLVWKPTDAGKMGTVNLTGIDRTKIEIGPFTDGRDKPATIGENREDEKGAVYPVTTSGKVADFCATNLADTLRGLGLTVVKEGGDVVLTGEVAQFFVTETNTYLGDVKLKLTVAGKDGAALWTGMATGTNKRFGRSYKAENYYETLSDSLLNAVSGLVGDEGFRKALAR